MAYRLLPANNKGGVGRTTTAVGITWAVAETGRRVLYVEMDPQGDGDRRLGVTAETKAQLLAAGNPGIAGVLDPQNKGDNAVGLADIIVPCGWDDPTAQFIDIVPSLTQQDLELRGMESHVPGAVTRLKRALRRFDDSKYHMVIINTGSSGGHLYQMALTATDWVVLVVIPDVDGIKGAMRVVSYIAGDANEELPERADPVKFVGWTVNNSDGSGDHRAYGNENDDEPLTSFIDPFTRQPIPQWLTMRHRPAWGSAMSAALPPSQIVHAQTRATVMKIYRAHAAELVKAGI
ncbi:ParA family protein [Dactylosporangium sp. CS-033363]|uniref:ParA family protein n=1 Tax=Dactylosporangium sp. CS-033363 TaxID=3239935 RepID=UPI003D8F388C